MTLKFTEEDLKLLKSLMASGKPQKCYQQLLDSGEIDILSLEDIVIASFLNGYMEAAYNSIGVE